MARKVECFNCLEKGTDKAYIQYYTINDKRVYFCCDECKNHAINYRFNELNTYYLIIEVINSHLPKNTQVYVKNQLKTYTEEELKFMSDYLVENKSHLIPFLNSREFDNTIVKSKYLFTILINKLENDRKLKAALTHQVNNEIKKLNFFNTESLNKSTNKRTNDISMFLDEE